MTKFEDVWGEVEESLSEAKAIAFDGCHKIYVLLDNEQVHLMAGYGYGYDDDGSRLIHAVGSDTDEMLKTLKSWWNESCPLRFINAVETNVENPNAGFSDLIPQGYEDEFCVTCGDFGADFDGYCSDCREEWEEDDEDDEEEEGE